MGLWYAAEGWRRGCCHNYWCAPSATIIKGGDILATWYRVPGMHQRAPSWHSDISYSYLYVWDSFFNFFWNKGVVVYSQWDGLPRKNYSWPIWIMVNWFIFLRETMWVLEKQTFNVRMDTYCVPFFDNSENSWGGPNYLYLCWYNPFAAVKEIKLLCLLNKDQEMHF